jgi:uncharacterized protein (DUF1015 family)
VYHQTYVIDGQERTRKACIAALQLSPFDRGIVLPHEQTHTGPKEDRLRLLRALQVHTGQIFVLYPDTQNTVISLLDAAIASRPPDVNAVEMLEKGVQQRLWVVKDRDTISAVQLHLEPMHNLIIADGHHRYETALSYRDERSVLDASTAGTTMDAAYNFCMAALVSMDDPGLVILPTHREVLDGPHTQAVDILARAQELFEVRSAADLENCLSAMAANEQRHAFGLFVENSYHVLILKSRDLLKHRTAGPGSFAWKSLDVTIAHKLLLEQVMGLSPQESELQTHVRYHRDPQLAVGHVQSRGRGVLLLLNPTRMDQVKACAQEGVKMPPKSTDFYPKMIAGLTMMPVGIGEQL